jgi:hypothetical protein
MGRRLGLTGILFGTLLSAGAIGGGCGDRTPPADAPAIRDGRPPHVAATTPAGPATTTPTTTTLPAGEHTAPPRRTGP